MNDDFINQLTLNCLISKQQLQKLNKKTKDTLGEQKQKEIEEYGDRIKQLFHDLLVHQSPDDLLFEVKIAFDTFIDKSIYYFKARDTSEHLEKERRDTDVICNDIDFEKEERDIENGNYKENDVQEEDDQDECDQEEDEDQDEEEEEVEIVKAKKCKTYSKGVDDIQKLPLDWFQNVRQTYKTNKIFPRHSN
jgi:hypothetical protein